MPVAAVLFIACCIFGHDGSFAFWQDGLSYEGESVYNYLQVSEDDRQVILSTNVLFGVQSVYRKQKELTGMYYDYAMAAPYMAGVKEKDKLDTLILGMGTGTFATQCRRYFDNMNITGVEIDQSITDLARKYFELSEEVPVVTYDGRAYLNADDKKYDVIMVDAYQDITIPFQMSSVEFFSLVKQHLNDNGVMVVNMNMRSNEEGDITEYLSDTIASVFEHVYTVDVSGSTNRELYAFSDTACMERFLSGLEKENAVDLYSMMGRVADQLIPYSGGSLIMTDDKAPVELLGMKVIDSLIGEEASFYKDIYKEQGLEGLLNWL
jgi:spermidine synthase